MYEMYGFLHKVGSVNLRRIELHLASTFLKRQAAHKLSVASIHTCITYRRRNVAHTLCIPWVACARIPPNITCCVA